MESSPSTTPALTSTTASYTVSTTSRPALDCSISSARTPGVSGSYCLAGQGHPRMRPCCERYGFSDDVQIQDQCHTWCRVNDDAFPDDEASDNGTRRGERLRSFQGCLWYGPDGGGDFVQGPPLLDCTFNDISGRGSVPSPGSNNETSTGSSVAVVNLGGGIVHFLVMVALILAGWR
ncbi:unnamed protein product [Cercospora beticola]|nr:unnamed protein product [Cercospora beticola]